MAVSDGGLDCDDDEAVIHPGAEDLTCDGVDQNCDAEDGPDADLDGWTVCAEDCDDLDAAQHPGQAEICNQRDDDCDGLADEQVDEDLDGFFGCPDGPQFSRLTELLSAGPVGAEFGHGVAVPGDMDNNGTVDLAISAPSWDAFAGEGKVFLHSGGPGGISPSPLWTITGAAPETGLGRVLAAPGDLNGDGIADLAVTEDGVGAPHPGRLQTYLGAPGGPSFAPSWTLLGDASWIPGSHRVAAPGDTNGDGYDDLIATARREALFGQRRTSIHLFLGSPSGLAAEPTWVITDTQEDPFNYLFVAAGDLNHDGFDDAARFAPCDDDRRRTGIRVHLGALGGLHATPDQCIFTGEQLCIEQGGLTGIGDLDGDGFDDLALGACPTPALPFPGGRVLIFRGSPNGAEAQPTWEVGGDQPGMDFGWTIAGIGDTNHDGYADLAIGAPSRSNTRGAPTGRIFVYRGSPVGPVLSYETSPDVAASFGFSIAAGDLNGDGLPELVVGGPYRNDATGAVWVLDGAVDCDDHDSSRTPTSGC